MSLTAAQDALLIACLGGGGGDDARRRALIALIADALGFSRSGDSLTGKLLIPGQTVGAIANDATIAVEEYGNGIDHVTKLTLTAFAVGTGGDAEDLAIGAKIYTFPAGTILVETASIKGIFDQASHGTITDGEASIGTVIGSGAVDTAGEVGATSENVLQGDIGVLSTYVLGTTVLQAAGLGVAGTALTILSAGVHDLFLNLAATWPNIAAGEAVTFTGVVTFKWRKIS
jgi:hypothetical protein